MTPLDRYQSIKAIDKAHFTNEAARPEEPPTHNEAAFPDNPPTFNKAVLPDNPPTLNKAACWPRDHSPTKA